LNRSKQQRPKLTEAHFEQQVRDYLEKVEGWRCFHFEEIWSEERKRTFGEPGMPDLLCIRYASVDGTVAPGPDLIGAEFYDDPDNDQVMWIELKRPGGKARANQQLWHIRERKCGALTLIAGEDFTADYEGFLKWYAASGLRRRA
jgi:hypothetical protein